MTRPKARGSNSTESRTTAPDLNLELGINNVMPASSWISWSGLDSSPPGTFTIGKDPLAPNLDELVFMLRRDGQARAMLNLLTLPIKAAFANSEWVAPKPGVGQKETDFANNMWTLPPNQGGMEISSNLFLKQILLALAYGFSAFEVIRYIPDSGPLKGQVTVKKMGYRDPRTVNILVDDKGSFQGLRQITNFANRAINVMIDKDNCWLYTANEEENPYYGISYFEPAFQHYQMKRKLYFIGQLASQLAAVPGRIGEIPPGATPRQVYEFKRALSNMALNNAMVTPAGFKVSPFNGNSNFDFLSIIQHHDMMMATSILAKFLQQEDRQVLIDNGKADASADMFVQMLESITCEIADALTNKLMPQFIDYNFGTGVYPQFKFAPLTDENKQAILQLFETMVAQPVLNSTPEFVRNLEISLAERLGFTADDTKPIDYEKVASEEENAAQEQKDLQQQQAAAAKPEQPQLPFPQNDGSVPPVNPPGSGSQRPPMRKAPGGSPASAGPVVKASAEAMDQLIVALSNLFTEEDIPEDFSYESEVLPETEE